MFFACHYRSKTPLERGGYTRTLQGIQEHYYVQERYKSLTSDVTTPNSLTQPNLTLPSFTMKAPLPPTTHNGSIYLSYNSANSSAFQATVAWGTHGKAIVNDAQPVINNTNAKITGVVDDLCG